MMDQAVFSLHKIIIFLSFCTRVSYTEITHYLDGYGHNNSGFWLSVSDVWGFQVFEDHLYEMLKPWHLIIFVRKSILLCDAIQELGSRLCNLRLT